RRRHTRSYGDWSSDVCSSDLEDGLVFRAVVLEDASYVLRQREAEDHREEDSHSYDAVNEVEADVRLYGSKVAARRVICARVPRRSEEHTSELQSPYDIVCRLL